MPDQNNFSSIFSILKPVKPHASSKENKEENSFHFSLFLKDGVPHLSSMGEPRLMNGTTPESRLHNEILRLTETNDIFGIGETNDVKNCVSIWEAPHLINLMKAIPDTIQVDSTGERLTFSEEFATLVLKISGNEATNRYDLNLGLLCDDEFKDNPLFLDDENVLLGNRVYTVKSIGPNFPQINSLIVPVDKDLLDSFLTLFLSYYMNILPELNGVMAKKVATKEQAVPTLFLEKVAADQALYLHTGLSIDSLNFQVPEGAVPTCAVTINENNQIYIREVEETDIEELTDKLEEMILFCAPDKAAKKEVYRDGNFFIIPSDTAGPFLIHRLHKILEMFRIVGSEKLKEYKVVAAMPKLKLRLSSGIDFLDGEGEIEIGNETFSIADILNQYKKNRYIRLSDGNRGIIEEGYMERLQRLLRRRDKNGKIRVDIFNLPEVEELLEQRLTGEFAAKSRSVLEGFNNLKNLSEPAYKVNATMRPYQNEGVKWLKYLYDNNLGGCLADDMGLGKTLQTIALLSLLYPGCKTPSLIVMPRSLLFNWEKELQRFSPQIKFYTYYGPDRDLKKAKKANVVLTTYTLLRNDIKKLKDTKFECVVLDESQNIKNLTSQTTMAAQLLDCNHRFALSGTPMENNLTELYSLFRFLNPAMFGTAEEFNASYTMPIQKYGDKNASESLRRKIFPFIMRRLKKEVLKDLPPRIDQTRYVEMSENQAKLYNERRLYYRQQIEETIAREGVNKSQFVMFQALSELRRIASVPESFEPTNETSPKIEELLDLLSESVSNGHKSVVFFNFLAGLEIVMEKLEKMGIRFETMTGSTSTQERKRIVERFQSDPDCMVMLLTLKVGGVGLNLTAADTVYIFEPWWNKAAEEQAINRLHRIGQHSTVNAFSIITVGTIEEKILQLQEQKSELFNDLISSDGTVSKHLSEKDIEFILS